MLPPASGGDGFAPAQVGAEARPLGIVVLAATLAQFGIEDLAQEDVLLLLRQRIEGGHRGAVVDAHAESLRQPLLQFRVVDLGHLPRLRCQRLRRVGKIGSPQVARAHCIEGAVLVAGSQGTAGTRPGIALDQAASGGHAARVLEAELAACADINVARSGHVHGAAHHIAPGLHHGDVGGSGVHRADAGHQDVAAGAHLLRGG
ncbi:hypothetical protein G6F50_014103 [Rhizopus delemar]|uniref:Uncharacterized protein n=1 Tax=Rhizopus delemar TaxID=936053 RepID=A0A9P6Y925_9FUNG|nr:hypothetical protein G6F50_014103 [Rhizopus delemar]